MSTDNNIPQEAVTQSINEQLIAVLKPVLHALPLEVVRAAIPAEARSGDINSVSKEDIIAHVRRHYSKQIFEPEEFISLVDWYITVKGVSVHDMFKHSSIESIFHEDDICEFIGDLDMDEVAQHVPEWKLVNWIKESHLTEQALELSDIKHLVGWHGFKIDQLFSQTEIRECVRKHHITHWYDHGLIRDYYTPTDLFGIDDIFTDLSLCFDNLKRRAACESQDNPQYDTITLVGGGEE
jgi:hypothetical protein